MARPWRRFEKERQGAPLFRGYFDGEGDWRWTFTIHWVLLHPIGKLGKRYGSSLEQCELLGSVKSADEDHSERERKNGKVPAPRSQEIARSVQFDMLR